MSPEEPPGPSTTTITSIDVLTSISETAEDLLAFLGDLGKSPRPHSPDIVEVPKLILNDHKRTREKFKRFNLPDGQLDAVLKAYRDRLAVIRKAVRDEYPNICENVPSSMISAASTTLEAFWIRSRNSLLEQAIEATAEVLKMLKPEEIGRKTPFKTEFVPLFEYVFGRVQGYIRPVDKRYLASLSDMDYNQITIWFQNRRARLKKKEKDGKALPSPPTLEETAAKLRAILIAKKPKELRFQRQRLHLVQIVAREEEHAIDMEENEYENEPLCARDIAEAELFDRHLSGELPGLFDSLSPPPHYRLFPRKARKIPDWVTPSYGTAPWPRSPDAFPHIQPTPLADDAIEELIKKVADLQIQLWKTVTVKKRRHTVMPLPEDIDMASAIRKKLLTIAYRKDMDGLTETWVVKGTQTEDEAEATLASIRQLQVQIDLTGLEDEDAAPEDQAQTALSSPVEKQVAPTSTKAKGKRRARAPRSHAPAPESEDTPDLEEVPQTQEQIAMELCDEMEDLKISRASPSDGSSQDSTSASDGEDTDSDDSSSSEESDSEDEGPNPLDSGPMWSRVCRVPTEDDDVPEIDMDEASLTFNWKPSDFPPQLPAKQDPVLINHPLPRDPSVINTALKTVFEQLQLPLPANIDEEIVPTIIPTFGPSTEIAHLNYLGEIMEAVRKDFPLPEDADLAPVLPEQFPDLNWYKNNYHKEPIADPIMALIHDQEMLQPEPEHTVLSEMKAAIGHDYIFEEVEAPPTVAIYDDWGNYVGERPRGTEPEDNEPYIVAKPRHPPKLDSTEQWIMANPFLQDYFGYGDPGVNQEGRLEWLGREDEWATQLVCSMPTDFGKEKRKRRRRKREPPPPEQDIHVEDLLAYGEPEMTYEECMDILATAERGVQEDEVAAQVAQEMIPTVFLDDASLWMSIPDVPIIASEDEQFNAYLQSLLAQDPIVAPVTTDPLTDKLISTFTPTDDSAPPSSSTDAPPSPGFLQQFLDFATKLTDPAEYMWQQFINPDGC